MEQLGIIAGGGPLPLLAAREARSRGLRVVGVAVEGEADRALEAAVDRLHRIRVGQLGALLRALKAEGVRDAIMVGRVPLTHLFSRLRPDLQGALLLLQAPDLRGDTILQALAARIERAGIRLHETTEFLQALLVPAGPVTRRRPTVRERRDIDFGRGIARQVAALGIGQTVVVKGGTTVAVESVEGTDAAIRRGGALAGGGVVVVKVARPDHDFRFDVPVVGPDTVSALKDAGATALALDAGRTFLLEREQVVRAAEAARIAIVAG